MTNHTARLYALVGAVLVFFVAWAAIAAHPWRAQAQAARDPRLAALQAREERLRTESIAVRRIVNRRWAAYRAQLALRKREIAAIQVASANARAASLASAQSITMASAPAAAPAAAPSVRVVTLPPLTITRTS
jgi:hypothetical protein